MNLLAYDFLKLGNKLYFVAKDTNIIFSVDINSKKIEFVDCIPDECIYEKCLCYKIISWECEMIFVPMNAKKIWRYNVENKKWHGIGLGGYEDRKNKSFQAFIYMNNLFMIGCGCPAIFQIDLITEHVLIIDEPFKNLTKKKDLSTDIFFRSDFVRKGNKIFMASCQDNSIMEFDLHNKKVLFHKVGNKKNRYSGIAWDGEDFWISPRDKMPIVRWDGETNVTEYSIPYDKIENEVGFLGVVNTEHGLLFYGKKQYSILMNKKENNLEIIPKTYLFYKKEKDSFISLDFCGKLVIENGNEKIEIQLSEEKCRLKEFQLEKGNRCDIYFTEPKQESNFYDMNDMIDNLVQIKLDSTTIKNNKIGYKIWNTFS